MAEPTWQQSLDRSDQARRERLVRAEAKYRERLERAGRAEESGWTWPQTTGSAYYPTGGTIGTYWPTTITNQFRTLAAMTATAATTINDWGATMGTVTANVTNEWRHWNNQANLMRTIATRINYPDVSSNVGHTGWEPRERPEPTQRELWFMAQRRLIQRVRTHSFELRRRVANRAAKRLLLEHLRDDQRREFEERGWFHVETAEGTRRYRIATGTAGNVMRLTEDGRPHTRYCIHPQGLPVFDTMLAQLLLLETDEEEFLRVANATAYIR